MIDPSSATREQITAAIGEWRAAREARLAADKVANELKKKENEHKDFIIRAMQAQKYEGMVLDGRITGVSEKSRPAISDWEQFKAFVIQNNALQLLQSRLSTPAIDEMRDAGVEIPGLVDEPVYDLFDRKA